MKTATEAPARHDLRVEFSGETSWVARTIGGLIALLVLAVAVGVAISGASYTPSPGGITDAGPIVSWMLPIVNGLIVAFAMSTVGFALFAAFLDPNAGNGLISRSGRRNMMRAAFTASIWCVLSLLSAGLSLAYTLGMPLREALTPRIVSTYAWDIANIRVACICAVLALAISIAALLSPRLSVATLVLVISLVAAATPATAGHAAGLGSHAVALVTGVTHSLAATTWVGGLLGLAVVAFSRADALTPGTLSIAAKRYSPIALWCVILLAVSGVGNAYTRLAHPADLLTSGYGQVVLIKTGLFLALVFLGFRMRQRILPKLATASEPRRTFGKIALLELALMALATGFGVALSISAPTRAIIPLASHGEYLLGFPFPERPTIANVLLGWHFDVLFLGIGIIGAVLYVAGVVRLRRRGDKWPMSRTILGLLGMAILIWGTNFGIATYAEMSVGIHMTQHMVLSMLAPMLIVLSGPVTLALRALKPSPTRGRGPRELLVSVLHSRVMIALTNPFVVVGLYALGLYGLYFTGLFGTLMASHVGHIAMTAHFLMVGLLLSWVVMGIDPQPRPIPYWSKLLIVLTTIVIHTFFAVAMMSTTVAMGASWYSLVRPPWLTDSIADSAQGGQIAWGIGEMPTVFMLLMIAMQWARSDEREAKRRDRKTLVRGDLELDDYNDYLKMLNERVERAAKHEAQRDARRDAKKDARSKL